MITRRALLGAFGVLFFPGNDLVPANHGWRFHARKDGTLADALRASGRVVLHYIPGSECMGPYIAAVDGKILSIKGEFGFLVNVNGVLVNTPFSETHVTSYDKIYIIVVRRA